MVPEDVWQVGDAYERYDGRCSRKGAAAFLNWLALPPGWAGRSALLARGLAGRGRVARR